MFGRRNPRFWFLNCCVSPQSEIARVRIDRSMISGPTDFRHIVHLGADDLGCSANRTTTLLASKGDDEFQMNVPINIRANDIPIQAASA
ncbi:unnamed protein product [Bursaphelenchus okinawaensis]|uniref:CRIB domain-containing protein n=1 Tax=Bursaphelenchus okinawaensis TaxID=465554 RepID=A0A811JRY9_9BILA|nr:unnamed protein product [Bursaphelenchus okinawaensis]CAG9080244.1 unnamed protein product [Bursaphelenchus okinawaensis]